MTPVPTPPPVAPVTFLPVEPDPGFLGGMAGGFFGLGMLALLFWLIPTALIVWGTYWLIRLAVRHGSMDAMRWQATGSPKKPKERPMRHSQPPSSSGRTTRSPGPRDW
ncbi:hypothetical protein [Microbacterium sp. SD291]|uniref:hypothetical protein n=1 Tax=Microbacterium sp. SD291 TaxID=2782007 RepID=UPI001A95A0DF|nr:hypothetical protein [Microbacterium sp. SD291]MBO0980860.1 hypothetical protein [Microbacterium sp. SD291]